MVSIKKYRPAFRGTRFTFGCRGFRALGFHEKNDARGHRLRSPKFSNLRDASDDPHDASFESRHGAHGQASFRVNEEDNFGANKILTKCLSSGLDAPNAIVNKELLCTAAHDGPEKLERCSTFDELLWSSGICTTGAEPLDTLDAAFFKEFHERD